MGTIELMDLENLFYYVVNEVIFAFQNYGWYLVFAGAVIYSVKPYVVNYIEERRRLKGLAEANDPERVRILDIERNRVREMQQKRTINKLQ